MLLLLLLHHAGRRAAIMLKTGLLAELVFNTMKTFHHA